MCATFDAADARAASQIRGVLSGVTQEWHPLLGSRTVQFGGLLLSLASDAERWSARALLVDVG